mmetsp:Transcript_2763/g.4864  ORF Transcript_2763/g.4864 Transcript_2763/m.4864 type:complete len:171 (+) Transcript_2763:42-554(+)
MVVRTRGKSKVEEEDVEEGPEEISGKDARKVSGKQVKGERRARKNVEIEKKKKKHELQRKIEERNVLQKNEKMKLLSNETLQELKRIETEKFMQQQELQRVKELHMNYSKQGQGLTQQINKNSRIRVEDHELLIRNQKKSSASMFLLAKGNGTASKDSRKFHRVHPQKKN